MPTPVQIALGGSPRRHTVHQVVGRNVRSLERVSDEGHRTDESTRSAWTVDDVEWVTVANQITARMTDEEPVERLAKLTKSVRARTPPGSDGRIRRPRGHRPAVP